MSESPVKGIDEKFCSECGEIIKLKAEICPKCGVRQFGKPVTINLGPVTANGKSRIAAALFAIFLGGFGPTNSISAKSAWASFICSFAGPLSPPSLPLSSSSSCSP